MWGFEKTLLLLQWTLELPASEQSISSEKSHTINRGWNIYLTVGKLEALLHLCCVLYISTICHLSHCCIQESFISHLLTVTFSSPYVFLFFVFLFFVFLFWQLCHGPCLYSFSSSLSNISLNTIAKSGMFIFLTSIFSFNVIYFPHLLVFLLGMFVSFHL